MDYAQTYHIGDNQSPRTKAATDVVPPVGRLRKLDAKTQRRKRGSQRQTQGRTNPDAANAFLKTSFLPKLKETQSAQVCSKTTKVERDFYTSLSRLAEHYHIEPMPSKHFDHPYNIALAVWDVEEKLKQSVVNWEEIRLVQDHNKAYIISEERYNTGLTLYYIPVEPLYQMLHDPMHKKNAHLLICVCSYLYHIAEVPYYRQENSYLYWMYQMHKEWVEQDEQTDETEVYHREFLKAELIGDCIERRIFNRINLQVFEQRLNAFKSRDEFDHECRQIAHNAFCLFTEYPKENIFRNVPIPKQEEDDYDNETIRMDKYISFVADTKGWLYESLAESVNNEFNEYGAMDEPTICKNFDGSSDLPTTNLDFETRLFAILDDVCSLLNNYQTARK